MLDAASNAVRSAPDKLPLIAVSNVLTIRPWPIRQTRIGTSRIGSHTRHNSEKILGGNNSPLGCVHLALANRYWFCMEKTREHVSVHRRRVNINYARTASRAWCQLRTLAQDSQAAPPPTAVSSVLTERNDSPLGCLNLALAYWYNLFWMGHTHICIYWMPMIVA